MREIKQSMFFMWLNDKKTNCEENNENSRLANK